MLAAGLRRSEQIAGLLVVRDIILTALAGAVRSAEERAGVAALR